LIRASATLLANSSSADTLKDMKALSVLFGGSLRPQALVSLDGEDTTPGSSPSALSLAVERAKAFPGVVETVLLMADQTLPPLDESVRLERSDRWTVGKLLERLARLSLGYDGLYYTWADYPFLDLPLAQALADRHFRFGAEYSYADGWPQGLAPELLAPSTASALAQLAPDDPAPVERDTLFSVLQRDINSFDIETELSPVDLRPHRLTLAADSKRNLALIRSLRSAGFTNAQDLDRILQTRGELLRTFPAFYAIQIAGPCPQVCSLCPYPLMGSEGSPSILKRDDFMEIPRFEALLDRIVDFSGDGVIDLSLWGEASLHPQISRMVRAVLDRRELSLVIETSGIGWKGSTLDEITEYAHGAPRRFTGMAPLSWIVSLDSEDQDLYQKLRGSGYSEAHGFVNELLPRFPENVYVQAVRIQGGEDDMEKFYRTWKSTKAKVIIQKYDHFCGFLPPKKATDLSPIKRRPCWHLLRDMSILIDGSVPLCREDLRGAYPLGNVFAETLETIWNRGQAVYREHLAQNYNNLCAECDEYYTYNF